MPEVNHSAFSWLQKVRTGLLVSAAPQFSRPTRQAGSGMGSFGSSGNRMTTSGAMPPWARTCTRSSSVGSSSGPSTGGEPSVALTTYKRFLPRRGAQLLVAPPPAPPGSKVVKKTLLSKVRASLQHLLANRFVPACALGQLWFVSLVSWFSGCWQEPPAHHGPDADLIRRTPVYTDDFMNSADKELLKHGFTFIYSYSQRDQLVIEFAPDGKMSAAGRVDPLAALNL